MPTAEQPLRDPRKREIDYDPRRPLRVTFDFDMNTARPDFTGNPADAPITMTVTELADLMNLAVKLGRGTETYLNLAARLERYGVRRSA